MITSTTKGFDESIYTEKVSKLVDLPNTLNDLALEGAVQLEQALLRIYQTAPPRDNSTFVWSLDRAKNAKARGWWFANLREGNISTDGRHYKRSGKPPYSVTVNLSQERNSISFQIKMKDPKMRFPFGALNGVDTRNPTHKRTGWVFASPLVDTALRDAQSALLLELATYLKDI